MRLYEELNDYLTPENRKRPWAQPVNEGATVKALLEALGVPPSEVDLVLLNGEPVPLERVLGRDDRVSIYPVFESFDIKTVTRVRQEPLRHIRFLTDGGLGRLGSGLRELGFDVIDAAAWDDAAIIETAEQEKRIVLTRDSSMVFRPISRLYVLQAAEPMRQLNEVIRRFDLVRESGTF